MGKDTKDESKEDSEIIEEVVEKQKPLTPQQLIHQSKTPVFGNANRFGKSAQGNNVNNRQRPGRAASRGR